MDNILEELYHGEYDVMGKYDKNAARNSSVARFERAQRSEYSVQIETRIS